uniref:Venom S1 protease 19 n=1 Tax=Ectomocoris sp. TaxID=3104572 RepID=A0AB38ZE81_9HEMI
MFLSGIIGVCCLAYVYGQQVYNVPVRHGQPYEDIKSPGYSKTPMPYGSSVQWNFVVESDSFIKVLCDDLRMGQNEPWTDECKHVYISFDEGNGETKVCGMNKHRYKYVSKGARLTVRMVSTSSGSGFMKCTAYNIREPSPTIMNLETNGKVQLIRTPKMPVPNFDQLWIINSIPGSRISFQCNFALDNFNPCYKNIITVDNGEEIKEYCGVEDKLIIITKKNYGKMRINLDEIGERKVTCIVQSVSGPSPNEHENVALRDEVDSSEHGVTSGSRQTSCKCGWVNRTPRRIIYGMEAGMHEFPWMVLLNVYFTTGDVREFFYCGASIITSRHVLTAAHCLVHQITKKLALPEDVFIRLAVHNSQQTSEKEQQLIAKEVFLHENYLKTATYDIAIIFTNEEIEFNDVVGPICLTKEDLPVLNKHLKIMGWGETEHQTGSDILLKSKAVVMDNLICNGLPEWEICTHTVPSTPCYGDSGGPLVWLEPDTNRYTQISLVSRGSNKICQYGLAISTKVSYFYDWIQKIIKNTDSSQNVCQKV